MASTQSWSNETKALPFTLGLDLGLRDIDLGQREAIGRQPQPLVDVRDCTLKLGQAPSRFLAQGIEGLGIDLLADRLLRRCFPLRLRLLDPIVERVVVIGREGILDDLPQRFGLQGGERVDLGLLDSERFTPTVSPLLGLLQRS